MPFYEYQCSACEHRLEALQKISDSPLLYCPECDEPGLKKLISRTAFRLKGNGWYETDFKNSGKAKANNETGGETGGETKNKTTDKKPGDKKDATADKSAQSAT